MDQCAKRLYVLRQENQKVLRKDTHVQYVLHSYFIGRVKIPRNLLRVSSFNKFHKFQPHHSCSMLGPKKYRKIARMYDRTGLSTKCTLIKIDLFRPSDPNSDLFRPFV